MAKKKSKKIEEKIQEPIVIEEKSEEIVEKIEEEVTMEEPEIKKKEKEEPVKEEKAPVEIKEKTVEEKIQDGAKAREEMKQAWMKRFNGDPATNQYSYNIGNLL